MQETYSFKDYTATVMGRTIVGLDSLDYDHEIKVEVHYGKGQEPIGYGEGELKGSGKMSVLLEEYEKLVLSSAAVGGDPLKLPPFPIVGLLVKNNGKKLKEILPLVKLKKIGQKRKVGDTKFLVDIDFELLAMPKIIPL